FRIPTYLSSNQQRNEAQMPRNRRMMRRFSGSNRRFPRFNTVDEVLLVIIGAIQFDFIAFGRDFAEPINIRGVKATTVDPDPTFGPDPLGSTFDIAVTTGKDDSDIIWILAVYAVLAACIPNGIFRWKLTRALDLDRASGLVAIQAPVRDIAMMPDP